MANALMEKINKQKAEMEAREARKANKGPRFKFWKPEKKSTIRILPPWTTEGIFAGQFWKEAGQHWGIKEDQEGPVLCPKITEGFKDDASCPICDFANKLKADKDNLAAQKLFKEIRAKKVYFVPVIDLKDPKYTAEEIDAMGEEAEYEVGDPKVQVYAAPEASVWNEIITLITNNEMDITDLTEGRDLFIEKKAAAGGKNKYVKYSVTPSMKATKAPVPEGFQTPSIEHVGWAMPYAEMVELLADGCGGDYVASLPEVSTKTSRGALGAGESHSDEAEVGEEADGDDDDLEASMRSALAGE